MFQKNQTSDFKFLFESLEFTDNIFFNNSLLKNHYFDAHLRLDQYIKNEFSIGTTMRKALSELSQFNLQRLVESPYLGELLIIYSRNSKENQILLKRQIELALIAELKIADPEYKHQILPIWSVDGDFVLDKKFSNIVPPLQTSLGIKLNYQSYVHNTGKKGIGGYDYATALKHRELIDTATELIANASKASLSLIKNYTKIIQLRQNSERPNVVNSSTETSIGLIRSDNFHKIHSDLPEIVDMLVHESIHQYLHLFEEQLFSFVNTEHLTTEFLEKRIFPSPWSGNLLDLRSFTHAILVWYGLMHFWAHYLNMNVTHKNLTKEQAKLKLAEAKCGFLNSRNVLQELDTVKNHLNSEYILNVEKIQKKVILMERCSL